MKRNAPLRAALAVVCIVVISVCAILLFGRLAGRARVADLTQHRLYTLSGGTRRILEKLNMPITLKLYYSRVAARKGPEQIRFWNNYYLYVRDLLDEFVDRSRGKLKIELIDPRPFGDDEEAAIRYGVRRFQLSPDEAFFFGLVAATELGKDETIPFFEPDRQEFVEYDVAKLLAALMQRDKRKIGVIGNAPLLGSDMSPYMMQMMQMQGRQPERPWTIVSHIRQRYTIEKVDLGGEGHDRQDKEKDHSKEPVIPSDVDFLMVVHPKGLDERTRYAIDQYVMKGGKAVVFVDPHCLQDRPLMPQLQMQMQHKANSDLNDLLETWGVRMEPEQIAVDRNLAIRVSLSADRSPERFMPYLQLGPEQISRSEVITADLHNVRMLFAGSLTKIDGRGVEVRPLLQTTKVGNAWKPAGPFELQFPDAENVRKAVTDGAQPLMLACLITGKFKTNFPNGIEVDADDEPKPAGDKPEKKDEPKGEKKEEGAKKDAAPATGAKKDAANPAAAQADPAKKDAAAPAKPADAKQAAAPPAAAAKDESKPPHPADAAKGEAKPPAPAEAPKDEKKVADDKGKPAEEKAKDDKPAEKKKKRLKPLAESAAGATVVVVADVDLLTDMLCYEQSFFGMAQSGDNAPFVFNLLDYLSGSEDLITIRSRGRYSRPFDVVEGIEKEVEKATADEVKAVNEKIKKFEEDLKQLGGAADTANIRLIQSVALDKRRAIEAQIREANKQLRKLQAQRREKVEALGLWVKTANIAFAPAVILVIAVALALARWIRARRYAARRV
jgi:ABC-type uncharacterized transport system involved in gliding motility auxiliary subunit